MVLDELLSFYQAFQSVVFFVIRRILQLIFKKMHPRLINQEFNSNKTNSQVFLAAVTETQYILYRPSPIPIKLGRRLKHTVNKIK